MLPRAARALRTPVHSRSLHATASRAVDPFPLPFDPALAEQHAAERAKRNPEDVIAEWAMPPPIDRTGETPEVMRARLVYQTRKRGTLENDLLFSTFAVQELPKMSVEEMKMFDKVGRDYLAALCWRTRPLASSANSQLLDEPDWDVYYWCTGKKPAPEEWKDTELLAKLTKHVKNEGKVHRFMPDIREVQKV